MDVTKTNPEGSMPTNPTVTVLFTGVMAFAFEEPYKYCQIGINTQATGHFLMVRVTRTHPDTTVFRELKLPHWVAKILPPLWLYVDSGSGLQLRSDSAIPYPKANQEHPATEGEDFRHLVNLEGDKFYRRPLDVRTGVLVPSLFVANGCFYSADLSEREFYRVPKGQIPFLETLSTRTEGELIEALRQAGGIYLGRVTRKVGLGIELSEQEKLVLKPSFNWPHIFALDGSNGKRYKIEIFNADDEDTTMAELLEGRQSELMREPDHFLYHYRAFILDEEKGEEEFSLVHIKHDGVNCRCVTSGHCDATRASKSHGWPT